MLKQRPVTQEVTVILPVLMVQVGCVKLYAGIAGVVFGAAIPLPGKLVQPFTVVVTVKVAAVFTVIEELADPLLHNNNPEAVVDSVDVPLQLLTTVTVGVGTKSGTVSIPF